MGRATHPGACHELEIGWGQWVQRLVPSAERLRFASSRDRSDADGPAVRANLHRPAEVLKFAGHFHGWHDFVVPAADPPYDGTRRARHAAEVAGRTPSSSRRTTSNGVEDAWEDDPQIGA